MRKKPIHFTYSLSLDASEHAHLAMIQFFFVGPFFVCVCCVSVHSLLLFKETVQIHTHTHTTSNSINKVMTNIVYSDSGNVRAHYEHKTLFHTVEMLCLSVYV